MSQGGCSRPNRAGIEAVDPEARVQVMKESMNRRILSDRTARKRCPIAYSEAPKTHSTHCKYSDRFTC
eukprot:gene25523-biopygen10664